MSFCQGKYESIIVQQKIKSTVITQDINKDFMDGTMIIITIICCSICFSTCFCACCLYWRVHRQIINEEENLFNQEMTQV